MVRGFLCEGCLGEIDCTLTSAVDAEETLEVTGAFSL